MKPQGIRTSYLNIDSRMDTQWETSAHNPADFELSLPNSIRTKKIWKVAPHTLIVPRMFPNIYEPDNKLQWYQRKVIDIPTGNPDEYLRTVSPDWTVTKALTIPPAIYNIDTLLTLINAFTGAREIWTYDETSKSIRITTDPDDEGPIFGIFTLPDHITPANYAQMTYIVEPPGSHLFDLLGFEKSASEMSILPLSLAFNPFSPITFDNLVGSNLGGRNAFPLFDRVAHDYEVWKLNPYTSPITNQPNMAGPVAVHIVVTDLGDSSTVDAQSGLVQDIITTINLGDVDFGVFKERIINDCDAEGIEYQQARDISNFRVRLLDSRNRALFLPRNFPVFLKLQLIHSLD